MDYSAQRSEEGWRKKWERRYSGVVPQSGREEVPSLIPREDSSSECGYCHVNRFLSFVPTFNTHVYPSLTTPPPPPPLATINTQIKIGQHKRLLTD